MLDSIAPFQLLYKEIKNHIIWIRSDKELSESIHIDKDSRPRFGAILWTERMRCRIESGMTNYVKRSGAGSVL